MNSFTKTATGKLASVEHALDRLKLKLKAKFGNFEPIRILPFRGFGNRERIWLRGRVLEDSGLTGLDEDTNKLDNLMNMWRRYESDEIPGAKLELQFGDLVVPMTTDDEGYFDISVDLPASISVDSPWIEVDIVLLDSIADHQYPIRRKGLVLIPPEDAEFGVISDIDDTIVKTGATHFLRHLSTVLLNNAVSREPFTGVAPFYRALQKGPDGKGSNPIFYVSSSPWNIYDLLEDFMDIHDIPLGPIQLKDMGLDADKFIKAGHETYKVECIERIIATYPKLPFLLIGDSGQRDAYVYQQVVRKYPNRILAVYLRDLKPNQHNADFDAIEHELAKLGVPMLLAEDSLAAARHAVDQGWLTRAALTEIEQTVEST